MSGGFYDYISLNTDMERICDSDEYREMAVDFEEAGHKDIADDIRYMVKSARLARKRIRKKRGKLENVMQAMEWWKSGDMTEDGFRRAAEAYRNGGDDISTK